MAEKRNPWYWSRWAIEQTETVCLKPTAAHVLLVLACYADLGTGRCEPGLMTVAGNVCRGKRETSRALNELAQQGLIKRRGRGPGRTAETQLLGREDTRPTSCQEPRPTTDQRVVQRATGPEEMRPATPKRCGPRHPRDAAHRTQNNQGNDQRNEESPEVHRRVRGREGDQEEGNQVSPLVKEVWSMLQGGVDGLQENDLGGLWPRPRLADIAEALAQCRPEPDLALRVASEVREIVQAQGRAPNVSGLYAKKLRRAKAEEARRIIRDSLNFDEAVAA
ncbi:MAG: helix-turn-helix domain-containing protein [Solirubrobacterales bacterium]